MCTPADSSVPVVVAVDGGPHSAGALAYGAREAQRRGAVLRLVHVTPDVVPLALQVPRPPEHLVAGGRRMLRHAARRVAAIAPGVEVQSRLRQGSLAVALVQASHEAQLLVLGRESRTGFSRLLNGSITAAVAARSTCPVAVVPDDWDAGAASGPVVVGVGDPGRSHEALARAFEEASRRSVPLDLVHAWKLPGEYDDYVEVRTHADEWAASARAAMTAAAAPLIQSHPDVVVELHVEHAPTVPALLAAASRASILILARPRHRILGAHLGRTARGVLHAAHCPVELVPSAAVDLDELTDFELEESGALLR